MLDYSRWRSPAGGEACEALCARAPRVTTSSSKPGMKPLATAFMAPGPNGILLMAGSAPGILLKPTPPLGPGHKMISARRWPKAIRLCLEGNERKTLMAFSIAKMRALHAL